MNIQPNQPIGALPAQQQPPLIQLAHRLQRADLNTDDKFHLVGVALMRIHQVRVDDLAAMNAQKGQFEQRLDHANANIITLTNRIQQLEQQRRELTAGRVGQADIDRAIQGLKRELEAEMNRLRAAQNPVQERVNNQQQAVGQMGNQVQQQQQQAQQINTIRQGVQQLAPNEVVIQRAAAVDRIAEENRNRKAAENRDKQFNSILQRYNAQMQTIRNRKWIVGTGTVVTSPLPPLGCFTGIPLIKNGISMFQYYGLASPLTHTCIVTGTIEVAAGIGSFAFFLKKLIECNKEIRKVNEAIKKFEHLVKKENMEPNKAVEEVSRLFKIYV